MLLTRLFFKKSSIRSWYTFAWVNLLLARIFTLECLICFANPPSRILSRCPKCSPRNEYYLFIDRCCQFPALVPTSLVTVYLCGPEFFPRSSCELFMWIYFCYSPLLAIQRGICSSSLVDKGLVIRITLYVTEMLVIKTWKQHWMFADKSYVRLVTTLWKMYI